ncbi:MAG: hypothetical protein ABTB30_08805 [Clostridia bacterium]
MDVGLLTLPEIREIYRKRLKHDFPANEAKPLAMIEKAFRDGRYRCYGVREGDDLLAYAFFVLTGDLYLLDYYAVKKTCADRGSAAASWRNWAAAVWMRRPASWWKWMIRPLPAAIRKRRSVSAGLLFTAGTAFRTPEPGPGHSERIS